MGKWGTYVRNEPSAERGGAGLLACQVITKLHDGKANILSYSFTIEHEYLYKYPPIERAPTLKVYWVIGYTALLTVYTLGE